MTPHQRRKQADREAEAQFRFYNKEEMDEHGNPRGSEFIDDGSDDPDDDRNFDDEDFDPAEDLPI